MNTNHIPYDITGIILSKMNNNLKCLLDDEVLLRFIIKYSNIHPETLLVWFVKQQRQNALVLYTSIKRQEVLYISDSVFILLCKIAIKNINANITKHLLNIYIERLKHKTNIFNNIVNLLTDVYIKTKCLKWLETLRYLLNLSCNNYQVDTVLILKILEKDKSNKIIKLFIDNQCVSVDIIETQVINYIIIYNHLRLLKFFVVNGYQITIYDIILCILSSNCKMVKYVIKNFKPRLYTRGFRRLLLSITRKKNEKEIHKYVYQRL